VSRVPHCLGCNCFDAVFDGVLREEVEWEGFDAGDFEVAQLFEIAACSEDEVAALVELVNEGVAEPALRAVRFAMMCSFLACFGL